MTDIVMTSVMTWYEANLKKVKNNPYGQSCNVILIIIFLLILFLCFQHLTAEIPLKFSHIGEIKLKNNIKWFLYTFDSPNKYFDEYFWIVNGYFFYNKFFDYLWILYINMMRYTSTTAKNTIKSLISLSEFKSIRNNNP